MTDDRNHFDDNQFDDNQFDDVGEADDPAILRYLFEADLGPENSDAPYEAAVALLPELTRQAPPQALKAATLARALRRRPPGAAVTEELTAGEGFRRTVAELDALLDGLSAADWSAPAPTGTVRTLVGHAAGVERYMLSQVGMGAHPDPSLDHDHVAVTAAAIGESAAMAPGEVRRRWHDEASEFLRVSAALSPDLPVNVHGLTVTLSGALVLRMFELWTHAEDICRATSRPLMPPEADRLRLMSSSLMAVLPWGMSRAGSAQSDGTIELELTGDGAGRYTTVLGDSGAGRSVRIVADAADICRLASHRVTPAALNATVAGDRYLADAVLVGLGAFAMD